MSGNILEVNREMIVRKLEHLNRKLKQCKHMQKKFWFMYTTTFIGHNTITISMQKKIYIYIY